MFIIINNNPINVTLIESITIEDHGNLLKNLSTASISDFENWAKRYDIIGSREMIKNYLNNPINFEKTFRIKILFKDKNIIFSSASNLYTKIDATNKMKDLCLLCNTIEASLPKINI